MSAAHLARAAIVVLAALVLAGCGTAEATAPPTQAPPTGSNVAPTVELPPPGSGELVVPRPGQLDVREIPADLLEAEVDGRSVTIRISFTSGVEPCYVLDTIVVTRGDHAFAVTLRQGHGPGDFVCIDIAVAKHALVDLGALEPGTYTITDAMGGAAPIEVVVG